MSSAARPEEMIGMSLRVGHAGNFGRRKGSPGARNNGAGAGLDMVRTRLA